MARLMRFEEHRFVGTRDDMRVYDCDDDDQFDELSERVAGENLLDNKLLQTFAPDSIVDARNRGFRPY
ncbi:MAG: hypothetical protein ACC654_09570 [Acidimicrobiia bacterium]